MVYVHSGIRKAIRKDEIIQFTVNVDRTGCLCWVKLVKGRRDPESLFTWEI